MRSGTFQIPSVYIHRGGDPVHGYMYRVTPCTWLDSSIHYNAYIDRLRSNVYPKSALIVVSSVARTMSVSFSKPNNAQKHRLRFYRYCLGWKCQVIPPITGSWLHLRVCMLGCCCQHPRRLTSNHCHQLSNGMLPSAHCTHHWSSSGHVVKLAVLTFKKTAKQHRIPINQTHKSATLITGRHKFITSLYNDNQPTAISCFNNPLLSWQNLSGSHKPRANRATSTSPGTQKASKLHVVTQKLLSSTNLDYCPKKSPSPLSSFVSLADNTHHPMSGAAAR